MTVLDEQDIREIHDDRYSLCDLKEDYDLIVIHDHLRETKVWAYKRLGEKAHWKFKYILPIFNRFLE
ncbi:hypothetical protein YSY43_12070 [Paenibacillus sp. YSY-4.3]